VKWCLVKHTDNFTFTIMNCWWVLYSLSFRLNGNMLLHRFSLIKLEQLVKVHDYKPELNASWDWLTLKHIVDWLCDTFTMDCVICKQ
jgi:hypothetical protein